MLSWLSNALKNYEETCRQSPGHKHINESNLYLKTLLIGQSNKPILLTTSLKRWTWPQKVGATEKKWRRPESDIYTAAWQKSSIFSVEQHTSIERLLNFVLIREISFWKYKTVIKLQGWKGVELEISPFSYRFVTWLIHPTYLI